MRANSRPISVHRIPLDSVILRLGFPGCMRLGGTRVGGRRARAGGQAKPVLFLVRVRPTGVVPGQVLDKIGRLAMPPAHCCSCEPPHTNTHFFQPQKNGKGGTPGPLTIPRCRSSAMTAPRPAGKSICPLSMAAPQALPRAPIMAMQVGTKVVAAACHAMPAPPHCIKQPGWCISWHI